MKSKNDELLKKAYAGFNRRDIHAVLELMSEDVDWPNAMEGTRVRGKDAVRAYWSHQWSVVNAHVEPVEIADSSSNKSSVRVNQVVRTLDGLLISEHLLQHVFEIENGLIVRMDVEDEDDAKDDGGGNRFFATSRNS